MASVVPDFLEEPSEEGEDWYEECVWCGEMTGRYDDHECDEGLED